MKFEQVTDVEALSAANPHTIPICICVSIFVAIGAAAALAYLCKKPDPTQFELDNKLSAVLEDCADELPYVLDVVTFKSTDAAFILDIDGWLRLTDIVAKMLETHYFYADQESIDIFTNLLEHLKQFKRALRLNHNDAIAMQNLNIACNEAAINLFRPYPFILNYEITVHLGCSNKAPLFGMVYHI